MVYIIQPAFLTRYLTWPIDFFQSRLENVQPEGWRVCGLALTAHAGEVSSLEIESEKGSIALRELL